MNDSLDELDPADLAAFNAAHTLLDDNMLQPMSVAQDQETHQSDGPDELVSFAFRLSLGMTDLTH